MPDQDDLRRLGRASGFSRRELVRCLELNLITVPHGEPSRSVLRRLRRIRRLRRDLGLGLDAVAIVVRLVDQIEASGLPPGNRRASTVVVDVSNNRSDRGERRDSAGGFTPNKPGDG